MMPTDVDGGSLDGLPQGGGWDPPGGDVVADMAPGRRRSVAGRVAVVGAVALLGVAALVAREMGGKGTVVVSGPAHELLGKTFVAVALTDDGRPVPAAPGAQVTLHVQDDRFFSADAGCNELAGRLRADADGRFLVEGNRVTTTAAACSPPQDEQERWFGALLLGEPTIDYGGGRLVLAAGTRRAELAEPAVSPRAALIGRAWWLDAVIEGGVERALPSDDRRTVAISEGELRVQGGCEDVIAGIRFEGGSLLVTGARREDRPCSGPSPTFDPIGALEGGRLVVEIEGSVVRLRGTSGQGLVLQGA